VTVREIDQEWIYDNYTCQASNAVNTAQFSVQLRRAGMFNDTKFQLINRHF